MKFIHSIYIFIILFFSQQMAWAQHTSFIPGQYIDATELYDDQYHIHTFELKDHQDLQSVELIINSGTISPQQNQKVNTNSSLDFFVGKAGRKTLARVFVPYYFEEDGVKKIIKDYQLAVHYQSVKNKTSPIVKTKSASSSLLSTGDWYKISIPKQGIYKIDRNFLTSMGVNVNQVNFQHLRIFGHDGSVIDEKVSADQADDMVENAIHFSSQNSQMSSNDYVLFYANGPTKWTAETNSTFRHHQNYYEDQSYYFISFDHGPSLNIASVDYRNESGVEEVNLSDDYFLYHKDEIHPSRMGKQWYSDRINTLSSPNMTQQINLPLSGSVGEVILRTKVAVDPIGHSNLLSVRVNNQEINSYNIQGTGNAYAIKENTSTSTFTSNGQNQSLQLKYTLNGSGNAYLGFVEGNYQRPIAFQTSGQRFHSFVPDNYDATDYITYKISQANNSTKVWNISNGNQPYEVKGNLNAGHYYINDKAGQVQKYYTFSGAEFPSPQFIETVSNQNLHALPQTDYLIISPKEFLAQARALADFHREYYGYHVTVVDVNKIYNEFSSGSQDIAGIRNFIKMFHDRYETGDAVYLKNVLLFGAASFDYKDIISPNTNFVPTFETLNSEGYVNTYPTDDFFAFLDEGENIESLNGFLDVGIGRIPANNVQEAIDFVDKIKHYHSAASFGTWKMQASFVADDKEEGMNHLNDCETISTPITQNLPEFTIHKIYSDAHQVISGASGNRYPTMNQAINERIFNGTFFMSYSGHGSPLRWSHEAILTIDDYGKWTNRNALPLMTTATCDFGRYDEPDPEERSAGTKIVMNNKGGAIAMITTTQAVFSSTSTVLSRNLASNIFKRDENGKYLSLGEAYIEGKNMSLNSNAAKFALLGDPAMSLAFPKHHVSIENIYENIEDDYEITDTFKALGRYKITGKVENYQGQIQNDFNGNIALNLYAQPELISTINNFPGTTPDFESQTNVLVNQKGKVTNGKFEIEIILPKDINFNYGEGKLALYAYSAKEDAMGIEKNITIGGYSNNPSENNIPPTVKVYIHDSIYHATGFTDPNPVFFIDLEDDIGFNISGSSVGHDLLLILDGDTKHPIVLNQFFEASEEGPHRGYIYYPMFNLKEGEHHIEVRAWDVHNNLGVGSLQFEVKKQEEEGLWIRNLTNYPNPFDQSTTFVFEHNLKLLDLELYIDIYNASGQFIERIHQTINPESNKVYVPWQAERLGKGIYFYKVSIMHEEKIIDQAQQKFVLYR